MNQLFSLSVGGGCPQELMLPKNFTGGRLELLGQSWFMMIGLPGPTEKEIEYLGGDLEVGLFKCLGIVYLPVYAVEGDWYVTDNPFSYELILKANPKDSYLKDMRNLSKSQGASCTILVVDTTTGAIVKMRMFAFTHIFTLELLTALEEQKLNLANFENSDRNYYIEQTSRRFSIEEMFKLSAYKTRTGQVD